MKIKLALDLDGVLFDFVKAICKHFGRPNPFENGFTGWTLEESPEFDGISRSEMFHACKNVAFWENLEKMPEADSLLNTILEFFQVENMCICTAPTEPPEPAIEGKRNSLRKYYRRHGLHQRVIATGLKYFLASPGTILVDDGDHNVEAFEEHGGLTILIPRPWNKRRHDKNFDFRKELLEKIEQAKASGYTM